MDIDEKEKKKKKTLWPPWPPHLHDPHILTDSLE